MKLQSFMTKMSQRTGRNIRIAGILGVVLIISALVSLLMNLGDRRPPRVDQPEVSLIQPERGVGIEQFQAQMNQLQQQIGAMEQRIRTLSDENARFKEEVEKKSATREPEISPLYDLSDGPRSMFGSGSDESFELDAFSIDADSAPPTVAAPPPIAPAPLPFPDAQSAEAEPTEPTSGPITLQPFEAEATTPRRPPRREIRVSAESGPLASTGTGVVLPSDNTASAAAGPESVFIPAGSMFTGVLLNGTDAPTSSAAQKNPTPVVIRVKREAVLPNYASIDVRECFLLAAGHGQLSTERALMRSENLSCVRHDGQVIETRLEAYIVGSDGKVGLPGRLVSKEGALIARSLLAGAFAGLGSAFNQVQVPSLNLDPSGTAIYERESLNSIVQTGIAGGFSSAANMVAKFYLDMAAETFPVVEVSAGEALTVVVTRGTQLPLKGSADLQLYSSAPAQARTAAAPAQPPTPSFAAQPPPATAPASRPPATPAPNIVERVTPEPASMLPPIDPQQNDALNEAIRQQIGALQ